MSQHPHYRRHRRQHIQHRTNWLSVLVEGEPKNYNIPQWNSNTKCNQGSSWGDLTTGAYVWYDNDISWKDLYGGLYNWYAVDDANGLCPIGWHVATNDEWTALTDFIGGTASPHGNELKSCRQVNSPLGDGCNTTEHPRWNEHNIHYGTDDFGFSCLPGGLCGYISGSFNTIGDFGFWWSSTVYMTGTAVWWRGLSYNLGNMGMGYGPDGNGNSVRCLRD